MNKKYELTAETIEIDGRILHRIRALRDFSDVKAGDIGGFIQKESNLSHEDNCWIYDDAIICDDAEVYNYAVVGNHAIVYENAVICNYAIVSGYTRICNNRYVGGTDWINE